MVSVLFLAQKLAALEVVNHRESIGLGKKCLSLPPVPLKIYLFESIGEKIKAPAPDEKFLNHNF